MAKKNVDFSNYLVEYPDDKGYFGKYGGTYIDKKVVVDGKLITSRSVAAALDFAYTIIENLAGKETLDLVKKQIYYEK